MDFQDHEHNDQCRHDPKSCAIAVRLSHFTYAVLLWLEAQREHANELRMLEMEEQIRFS